MAFGNVTQGGAPQAGRATSNGPGVAPSGFGNNRQFVGQMAQYYQGRVLHPETNFQGQANAWQQGNDRAALTGYQNQIRQYQQQDAAARQGAHGPAPATAQAPAQPAAPAPQAPQPAQQAAAAPPNPLLAALQGSPMAQGTTNATAGALSRAITGQDFGGVTDQDAFLKQLRAAMAQGGSY